MLSNYDLDAFGYGMNSKKAVSAEPDAFTCTMSLLEADPRIRLLQNYQQHQGHTTFQHCRHVAVSSYRLAKVLHLKIDGKALATGAMLHDYYLYNYRDTDIGGFQHGVSHPQTALENAEKEFELTEIERNIITSHMWPLTLTALPRGREAMLVVITDKYCALNEMICGLTKRVAGKMRVLTE
ncbi:MAG: HD domain-containing protein [Eubacteriales bacterium]|nr:HD domain-containing protein [Eubacteriales bacterium]